MAQRDQEADAEPTVAELGGTAEDSKDDLLAPATLAETAEAKERESGGGLQEGEGAESEEDVMARADTGREGDAWVSGGS